MASKVRYKFNGLLWITALSCVVVLVQSRPSTENSFIDTSSDPSDRTLIRVLRSEFEEDEKEQTALKARKTRKVDQHFPPVKKRASEEEDQFFQALLSRTQDKPVEKRSYETQPEKDDVGMNWKGDSKISDADKKELEHLFNSIGMVDDEKPLKGKIDAKRATGNDGKVSDLVEWLMSKPPKEFHESLRHIIDVEQQVSGIFGPDEVTSGAAGSDIVVNDPSKTESEARPSETTTSETTTSETTSDETIPVSLSSDRSSDTPDSVAPPVITEHTTSSPEQETSFASQPTTSGVSQPVVTSVSQPAVSSISQPALSGVTQVQPAFGSQPAAQPHLSDGMASAQASPQAPGKKPDVYADVTKASKMMAQTGPGPLPMEAMDYFNKMGGGGVVSQQQPQGYSSQPQAPVQSAQPMPAMQPQQTAAVSQPIPPQQNSAQQYGQQQQQQSAYSYNYQDQRQANPQTNPQNNPYYNRVYHPPKPYVSRNGNYQPPAPRPYPMHKDQLDKSTEKKTVKASLLFKQNWSNDFHNKKSTRYRIFKHEAKDQLYRVFETKKNFKKVVIDKIKEDRGKVIVAFTIKFKKETKNPLRPLYEQIARDKLGNMPVYRDTLVRGDKPSPKTAPVRTAKKMEKSQSENPATEFAEFADKIDRELTGENLPLNEKHEAYQGCFKDKKPRRDMKKHFSKFEMTPEWCLHTCKKEGYRFAGVQYSYLCFCGNKFGKYGRVPDSECSSRCYGDKNRFCGSFWHNSIYSVDGQHHDPDEFSAIQDDDEEENEDDTHEKHDDHKKKEKSSKDDEKEHAEVANHLMKAASSALKAAKKLLPGKDKRQVNEGELYKDTEAAQQALKAVDEIVEDKKNVDKRSAENSDGRNLLMAYLGNVGGYDREYRSVEDENKPVDKLKFEYKRMIIDEEGDGEFVSKPKDGSDKLKRSRRSLESEDFDGRKKMALRAMDDGSDATNPKTAVAAGPSRRELLSKDVSDKEIKRLSRDTDEEEEEAEEREMSKARNARKTEKRSVGIDKNLYHANVQEGVEKIMGGVIDVMKETTTIGAFKEDVEKLVMDVANGLAIPPEQKDQVTSEIRQDIKETGTSSVNKLNEYGEMHPAVGPQADEAAHTFSDIPLDANKAEEIKTKIRKRSVDDNDEGEQEFLSDILKEHFKLNP